MTVIQFIPRNAARSASASIATSIDARFRVQRKNVGPSRTFWWTQRQESERGMFSSLPDVQQFAEELLDAYMTRRGISEAAVAVRAKSVQQLYIEPSGKPRNWVECYLVRGGYRVEINGLPDALRDQWAAVTFEEIGR